jgi:ketosteroid isomerase-like protein
VLYDADRERRGRLTSSIVPAFTKRGNGDGRDSIRKSVSGLLGLPGLTISWQPTKVEVARGGDLAYVYGRYEVSFDEAPGKRTTDRGKIVEIWKKQADGNWKCIVDTWNSDLPAAAPSTPSS